MERVAVSHTPEDYGKLLRDLLPPGQAFSREPGTDLEQLLLGMGVELSRVEARADVLALEVVPSTTSELLPDWERAAGLPDNCSMALEDTAQGRRNSLIAKLSSLGGQSISYFVGVLAGLGYQTTITEFRQFRAGLAVAGDPLTNGEWIYVWRVNAPETTIIEFRAGLSAAGEPLRSWGNEALECKINALKPAHTLALFGYGATEAEETYLAADRLFYVANYVIPADVGTI
jgi:uncharacterized protein YmfQ (DUF2313 family)